MSRCKFEIRFNSFLAAGGTVFQLSQVHILLWVTPTLGFSTSLDIDSNLGIFISPEQSDAFNGKSRNPISDSHWGAEMNLKRRWLLDVDRRSPEGYGRVDCKKVKLEY